MDYKKVLDEVMSKVKGAIYVTFCGSDGLGIASSTDNVLPPEVDLGDEKITSFLVSKANVLRDMNIGRIKEDITITKNYIILVRMVTDDYFVSMVCTHAVNIKIARYYLYKVAKMFRKELK
ncbi:MAG: hypothetical protein FXF47_01100 [Candidatus Mcinerneyibacterium aminivorans]|uniref:Roadblock/LC7 domain-containing protein n=1 Tax=Candidatus Mcinerneyibacterium aminivorans TaxID=2703815 RepID=A0A5D0MED3_9BACT|nr:MAG: hypothetical protein FXF47_01100 [Candidatus Mcinerneyibacterium aminivorans]